MSYPFGNEDAPFGSAKWADAAEAKLKGMFRRDENSPVIGHIDGQPIYFHGDGGIVIVAGSRAGKGACFLVPNICAGQCRNRTQIVLNTKSDLAYITLNQTMDNKAVYCWDLEGMPGLPQDSVNPFEPLKKSSPRLMADIKVIVRGLLPPSGSSNGKYFEGRGRDVLEALTYVIVWRDGDATLPALYEAVNTALIGGERWKDLAADLDACGNLLCQRVRREIQTFLDDPHGAMKDIMGEVTNALSCLSDPKVMEKVSPPFSCSMEHDLCATERFANLFIICEALHMETRAPIIQAMLNALFVVKGRKPEAPQQDWIMDEAALLQGFDLLPKLFSYAAGLGIRPWAIFQSLDQMDALGHKARQIILSSAQLQIYFGIRELTTAQSLSAMIGDETLSVKDPIIQVRARSERRKLQQSLLDGADPFKIMPGLSRLNYEARHRKQMGRRLCKPEEILRLADEHIIYMDGLSGLLRARHPPYWLQEEMAGRYLGDPQHPPIDSVMIMTVDGPRRARVITKPVPEQYAHLPQYREGLWSYVEGHGE
ncbi:MAG: type IV secretory system conjugative DNA transfer family protein [Rhodobacteraceae bacterium]|nr:type IV secretory system conjugative DNA transfer family protein [Paracoccaceae bacterium]